MDAINSNEIQVSNFEILNILENYLPIQQAEIITKIYDMLDAHNYGEYIEELSNIKDVDQTDIDPIDLVDSIKGIARKYARKLIYRYGIIINDEVKDSIPNSFYYNILLALYSLKDLDISDAVTIQAILTDELIKNDIERLSLILDTVNPNMENYNLFNYIADVSELFFAKLGNSVENIINNSDISIDELDNEDIIETFTLLTEFFVKLKFKSLPNLVMLVIHDPDMLDAVLDNISEFKTNIIKKMNLYYREMSDSDEIDETLLDMFKTEITDYFILSILEKIMNNEINVEKDQVLKDSKDELLELYVFNLGNKDNVYNSTIKSIIEELSINLLEEKDGIKLLPLLEKLVRDRKEIEEDKDV